MADEIDKHPALKDFNPAWEGIKHVGLNSLKWAAYLAIAAVAVPAFISVVTLGAFGTTWSLLALGAGAAAGAVLGGIKGFTDVEPAINNSKMDRIADWDHAAVSRERHAMMNQNRGQGQTVASAGATQSPNIGFGMGGKVNQQGQMVS